MIHDTQNKMTTAYAVAFFCAAERNFHGRALRLVAAMGPWRTEPHDGVYGRETATRMLGALSRSLAHTRRCAIDAFDKLNNI